MEDKYTFETSEHTVHGSYEKFAKDLKGTWDGEELNIDTGWCTYRGHSFCFLEEMYVGIFELNSKKPITVKYEPDDGKTYISIRIGFTGSFFSKGDTKKFHNLGVFIYNSSQQFEIELPHGAKYEYVTIRFSVDFFNKFTRENANSKIKALFQNKTPWFHYLPLDVEIENCVRTIIANVDKDKRRDIYFFSKALDIVGIIQEKLEQESTHIKKNIHPEDLKAMMQLKDEYLSNFTEQPNLSELSDEFGMSISKLNRIFKSIFDQPILQFYKQQKVEEVYRQIIYTDKSLTEISMDLNFSDNAHMSNVFKKYYGYAPSELKDKKDTGKLK